ncbi:MAG TPA: hypothetical protein VHX42_01965, partial [Candidatus Babeliales bacterium]|nr:hypothetical protein [Candidatus Babeliales bacterium]
MNRAIRLLFLSFVTTFLFVAPITPSFLEFKHAVARYVKYTDTHGLLHSQRHTDENVPYKKELRYLFKNYDTISPSALLSRIRSAHQEMLKYESDVTSDVYKRYEQISSALLLICAQSFFYDAQNQILNALDEIDQLIIYWRYQQHHQTSYFFGKSPHKWIIGKSQTKEITHNVVLLERKQGELYTLLGALAGHAHGLTTCNIYYDDCYAWINELLAILPYNYENSESVTFDDIAAQLAVRMKKVDVLTQDLLRSVAFAQKPNHFMQHWIAYTAMLAAMGFIAHYHAHNPTVIPAACGVAQVEAKRLFNLLINPFDKIYKRLKIAFSFSDASHIKNDGEVPIMKDELGEFEKLSLDQLCDQIQQVGKEIESDISEELKKSNTSLREDALVILEDGIEYAHNKWVGSYTFDIKTLNADLQLVRENNDP